MLNKIIYLAKNFTFLPSISNEDSQLLLSIILHNEQSYSNLLSQIYKPGSTSLQFNFCVCFDMSNPTFSKNSAAEFTKNEQIFFQIIFSKNYCLQMGKPAIAFLVSPQTLHETNQFIETLERNLATQGYDAINKILLSSTVIDGEEESIGIILDKKDELQNGIIPKYYELLKNTNFFNSYIGCMNLTFPELSIIRDGLQASENHLKENFLLRYLMMVRQIDLLAKSEKLKYDLENAKKEIHNKETYLEVFISQDQANQINKFYHYEYEILPLWYKHVGQIIKVITGKRTFRSLFNKNVTKYKE